MRTVGCPAIVCTLAALALVACGGRAPLPRSCTEATPADVLRALQAAPRAAALADGTPLSTCVARAVEDADLQTVGATLTTAADRLAQRLPGSDGAALQLGFLIGAVERGAAQTPGVQAELARRIGQAPALDGGPPARRDALARGRAAGRRRG
jgi:hypothetical protein